MKVLIAAYSGLGNLILRTPMLHTLSQIRPDLKVDLITGNSNHKIICEVSNALPSIEKVHLLKKEDSWREKINFFLSLKKEKYQAIFLPFDSQPRFLIYGSLIAKIPLRVLHGNFTEKRTKPIFKRIIRLLIYPKTLHVPFLQGHHEIDLNYDLLEAYINFPITRDYQTHIPFQNSPEALKKFKLDKEKYIVLQIGARYGSPTPKTWHPNRFIELIRKLHIQYPTHKIVTVGSKGDTPSIKRVTDHFSSIINTEGRTSFNEVATILSHCDLAIVQDSGIMHIANGLNINLIALYGPTDYTRTRPLNKCSEVIYSKNQFFAKMYNLQISEDDLERQAPNHICMDAITVNDVLKVVKKKLKQQPC